jgi:hypothetical protein
MSEQRITEALRALRRADFDLELDGEAEVRTLLKFRRQRRRRRLRKLAWGGSALSIAAVALVAILDRPKPEARHVIVAEVVRVPAPTLVVAPPLPRRSIPKRKPEEVVTPFYPLMVSAPPFESGLLVRMTVPASAMRSVGLPVGDDHLSDQVLADVLVGQDDLARAIRFVSYR